MILNLTQHAATPDQKAVGVVDMTEDQKALLSEFLTFDKLPSREEVLKRAELIAQMCLSQDFPSAMIGGAPYLMDPLTEQLKSIGVKVLFAFSVRESIETITDGIVKKTAIFKHAGFVEG